jgi:hypothetical protein
VQSSFKARPLICSSNRNKSTQTTALTLMNKACFLNDALPALWCSPTTKPGHLLLHRHRQAAHKQQA